MEININDCQSQSQVGQQMHPSLASPVLISPSRGVGATGTVGKRRAMKRSSLSFSSRRRASLGHAASKRGHSDDGLVSAKGTAGLSHFFPRAGSKKKIRRNISWDVRPPRVHQINSSSDNSNTNNNTKKKNTTTTNANEDESSSDVDRKNASWYSKEEYGSILQEQMNHIMVMQYLRATGSDDSELDPEKYCERGLESYQSKERKLEIETKRKLHQFLVIQEQARQASLGTKDPERIRLMAASQSEGSLRKAQLRAALDQHESHSGRPLTEEEKLRVALEQHQRIVMCEKAHEALAAAKAAAEKEEDSDHEMQTDEGPETTKEHDIVHSTGGIVTLASLWAQEDAVTACKKNEPDGNLEMTKVQFPGPSNSIRSTSNASFSLTKGNNALSSYLNKAKGANHRWNNRKVVSQAYLQQGLGLYDQKMPMVAFSGTSASHGAVAQNALKSSCNQSLLPNQSLGRGNSIMTYPTMNVPHEPIPNLSSTGTDHASIFFQPSNRNNNSSNHMETIIPTATLAALQIKDQEQQQQQQQQQ